MLSTTCHFFWHAHLMKSEKSDMINGTWESFPYIFPKLCIINSSRKTPEEKNPIAALDLPKKEELEHERVLECFRMDFHFTSSLFLSREECWITLSLMSLISKGVGLFWMCSFQKTCFSHPALGRNPIDPFPNFTARPKTRRKSIIFSAFLARSVSSESK